MDTLEHEWTGRDVADPAVVSELADAISAIGTRKSIEAVVEVGRLLFDRCHSGLRDRVGRSATIDALAAAPGAPFKRAGLYRAVQIFLQWEDMPPDVRDGLGPPPKPTPVKAPVRKRDLPSLTQARQSLQPWAAAVKAGRKPSRKEAETVLGEVGRVREILTDLEAWAAASLRA